MKKENECAIKDSGTEMNKKNYYRKIKVEIRGSTGTSKLTIIDEIK